MSELEVIVLGVGDSFSEQYHPTSLLVVYDGFHLAIDCPDMYRRVLKDASTRSKRELSLVDIDHVLITHVHGDHMNGLEGVGFFKRFAQGKTVDVIASPEVREVIWDQRLVGSMGQLYDGRAPQTLTFGDYFTYTSLPWDGPTQVGPLTIRTYRTKHHVPTTALFIEAGGHTFGYSCDTAFDPDLIAFLSSADLIVHETNFGPAHTGYDDLAQLPEDLRKKMRLIHYADGLDLSQSSIRPVTEGEVLVMGT